MSHYTLYSQNLVYFHFLKLAFGEMASVILDSQAVVSQRLDEAGFHFKHESVDSALNAIFQK